MTTRHYGYISLAAVLLAVLAAGLLWLQPWSTDRLTPLEAADKACSVLQTNHYDMVTSMPIEAYRQDADYDTLTIEVRYGDGAHHEFWTITSSEGVLMGNAEKILVDGKLYSRETIQSDPTSWHPWFSGSSGIGELDQPLPCLTESGQTTAEAGDSPDTYKVTHTSTREDGVTFTTEFYADSAGVPTNANVTTTDADGALLGTYDITFSGVGEVNIIEAPTVP